MTPDDYWAESELPPECVAWIKQVDAAMKRDWFIDTAGNPAGGTPTTRF